MTHAYPVHLIEAKMNMKARKKKIKKKTRKKKEKKRNVGGVSFRKLLLCLFFFLFQFSQVKS